MTPEPKSELAEERQSLWLLTISPAIWTGYFLASYIGASVWCGVLAGREGGLGPVRAGIAAFAVLALIGIGITGRIGWRRHKHGESEGPHQGDTPEDRYRFLGLAAFLLSVLSAVATVYVALVAIFIRSCV